MLTKVRMALMTTESDLEDINNVFKLVERDMEKVEQRLDKIEKRLNILIRALREYFEEEIKPDTDDIY